MSKILPPAPSPCISCPYRRDVPSAIWDPKEYAHLPAYDNPTHAQPLRVFMCHQQDSRLCAGWVAVHDMSQSLAFRFATSLGGIAEEHIEQILDYRTNVPLFASGHEAAEHGMRDIDAPGRKACVIVARIRRKRKGRR